MEISLDDTLHVLALVIQIAHAAPALAGIVVGAELVAVLRGPFLRITAIVVGTDVGRYHLVVLAFPALFGEVHPATDVSAMINHDIGDGTKSCLFEGIDHRAQLGLVAKRAVVVVKPPQVVVAHRLSSAVTALWNPNQVKATRQIIGLLL